MPDNVETKSETTGPELLAMSDEEFLKMNGPTPSSKEEEPEKEPEKEEKTDAESAASNADPDGDSDKGAEEPAKGKPAEDGNQDGKEPDKAADKAGEGKPDPSGSESKDKVKTEAKGAEKPVNYEGFYKQIMTPFKANGKTIEVKSPEEAIRLMQMGAGYGRKIQELQPHLKVIRMLEKNDLLDVNKLSFLIDVTQKNPEAIKKLIKDTGIDPLDLNPDDKVAYQPKDHAVSDKEMAFQAALGDIQSHPTGSETLRIINQTWDQESKGLLWDSPELLEVIQTQRDNGVYDQIAAEIDRQKTLGAIPHSAPFLQAYKAAGDHLVKTNGFKPIQNQPGNTQQPQVIATRTATPKTGASNSDQAAAASPTKTSTTPKQSITVNPLQMSDDDFMKQFASR